MEIPDYLLKRGERGNQKIIARWRCNEEERNGFWKIEEKKKNAAYAEWKKYRAHNVLYED